MRKRTIQAIGRKDHHLNLFHKEAINPMNQFEASLARKILFVERPTTKNRDTNKLFKIIIKKTTKMQRQQHQQQQSHQQQFQEQHRLLQLQHQQLQEQNKILQILISQQQLKLFNNVEIL